MLEEFKGFILRGRVVDLAVGIVVGIAFAGLVNSLVGNLLTPALAIPGKVDFSQLSFKVGGGTFRYGAFLNDLISFIVVAGSVFFFVVRPIGRMNAAADDGPETTTCTACLSTIPAAATRCAFCTSDR